MAQVEWDSQVAKAVTEIFAVTAKDVRPTVFDKVSKQWVLVDTGAACSVFPKAYYPHAVKDPTHVLKAVNGEKIATYGKRRVEFNFGGRKYLHDVKRT